MIDRTQLLGGIAPATFMREHWHKKLRLIRQAIPDFRELLTVEEILALATRDDVESRLIVREGKSWTLEHGPFKGSRWKSLPKENWTLLVQGLNLHLPQADELLRAFAFVPYARLDDIMVSLAAPGGGVGPHFDSYDVFLLQGQGTRRWKLSEQEDLELEPNAPLKILKKMRAELTHDLQAGDMLYLPPKVAHDGVAIQTSGYCTTYSVGFRAPTKQEIAEAFAHWLVDTTELEGRLEDPELKATNEPALIPKTYASTIAETILELGINRDTIAQFAGSFATEPKASVGFIAPEPALSRAKFASLAKQRGVFLDPRTLCAYDAKHLFVNGEAFTLLGDMAFWRELANARAIDVPASLANETFDALYEWYDEGWLHVRSAS